MDLTVSEKIKFSQILARVGSAAYQRLTNLLKNAPIEIDK
jgi:hypothetical protein